MLSCHFDRVSMFSWRSPDAPAFIKAGGRVATPAGAVFRSGNWEQVDIQVQLGNQNSHVFVIFCDSVMKVIFRMIFSISES